MSSSERDDPWFIVRVVIAVAMLVGGGGFAIYEIVSNSHRQAEFRADVKQRCKVVYKTLDNGNVTSIYRCPDDTQYEFTERL